MKDSIQEDIHQFLRRWMWNKDLTGEQTTWISGGRVLQVEYYGSLHPRYVSGNFKILQTSHESDRRNKSENCKIHWAKCQQKCYWSKHAGAPEIAFVGKNYIPSGLFFQRRRMGENNALSNRGKKSKGKEKKINTKKVERKK